MGEKRKIQGHPEFEMEIGDKVRVWKGDKLLQATYANNKVSYQLNHKKCLCEGLIKSTFPGISKKDYIYALYNGVPNKPCSQKRKIKIMTGLCLYQLWRPSSYMLSGSKYYGKMIKQMYRTPIIETEGLRFKKETYFTTDEHIELVAFKVGEKLKEFGEKM